MDKFEENLIRCGRDRDNQSLRMYVKNQDTEDILSFIQKRIHCGNFINLFNYLLDGFGDDIFSQEKRFKSVQMIIKELKENKVANSLKNSLITRLCFELHKFNVENLIELTDYCIGCIQNGNETEEVWKEFLPVLLDILLDKDCVEYNGDEMSGSEFKSQFISSLVMMNWSTSIITALTCMFGKMRLTVVEHNQVVNKLGQQIEKLTPQEVPSFVYQLLKLCKEQNGRSIFLRLQNYFGTRIYNNNFLNMPTADSMDLIGNASDLEALQAESTVLYHIHDMGHDTKDYLNSLKNLTKTPEFVLHPFQLTVLLTLSTIPYHEEKVFEIIKGAITKTFNEEQRKQDSHWFRDMVHEKQDVAKILLQIINISVQDRDVVVQGLINLTFVLLGSASALGREALAEKMWELGRVVAKELIKQKRHLANVIIQRLRDLIITEQNVHQYIECFRMISKRFPLLILENQSCIVELMEQAIQVSGPIANEILDAILPLTKVSHTTRDHLILLLRKALYSRSLETRQMSVSGYVKLMKNLKISNSSALSQNSSMSSGLSLLTQISMTMTGRASQNAFTNESLCLEILGILRRCMMQEAEVKGKLYESLYDTVCVNGDLGEAILELLWSHFLTFYETDEEILPPVNLEKTVQIKDTDAVLIEPLGKCIYYIGLIVAKVGDSFDSTSMSTKFSNILTSLSKKFSQCEVEHFQLNDGTDLLDVLPESQKKMLILKESMLIYEVLIGYRIISWSIESENCASDITHLFQGYNRLVQFSKNLSKKGKKKKDPNRTTQTLNSSREGGAGKNTFKSPDNILNLETVSKVLNLLHQVSVDWCSMEQANILKRNVEFHQYYLQLTINLVLRLKQTKNIVLEKKREYYEQCTDIANTLYKRCVSRYNELSEFDAVTAQLAIEAFYLIMVVINMHYKDMWLDFLKVVVENSSEDIIEHLTDLFEVYKKLFEEIENSSQDSEVGKIVINSISLFGAQIPSSPNVLSNQVLNWMKQISTDKTISGKLIVQGFLTFMFKLHVRHKSTTTLFKTYATALGDILTTITEEDVEHVEAISIINEGTINTIIQCLCSEIKYLLDDINWIIMRMHSEYSMLTYPGQENIERRRETLKGNERNLCCQLCQIITIMTILSNVSIPAGPCCEDVVKINLQIFYVLQNLTKYFSARSTKLNVAFQTARFETVVKQAGRKLAPTVYTFILYIEQNQTATTKKNSNTLKEKILRETKSIPKLVFEMEKFNKALLQLSKKTKVDVAKYMGQGTTRDFRIKVLDLKSALSSNERDDLDESGDNISVISERESTQEDGAEEEDDNVPPPAKRNRQ